MPLDNEDPVLKQKQDELAQVRKQTYLDMINKRNAKMDAMASTIDQREVERKEQARLQQEGQDLLERAQRKAAGIDPDEGVVEPTGGNSDQPPVEDQPQLITRTINGKQVSKTFEEWMEAAEKVEDADAYLRDARSYKQPPQEPAQEPVAVDVDYTEEELGQMTRNLQLGDEAIAGETIKKITEQAVKKATAAITQKQQQFNQQQRGLNAWNEFKTANPDIFANKALEQMVIGEDARLMQANYVGSQDPVENFTLRINEAGKNVRAYLKTIGAVASTTRKDAIKSTVNNLPSGGGVRGTPPAPKELTMEENNALAAHNLVSGRANALMRAKAKQLGK